MGSVTIALPHGLQLDGIPQREAEIREASAGDVIQAAGDAEQLLPTREGWQLVPSPSATNAHLLRRQIVRIGEIQGPLTLQQLYRLHHQDLEALQSAIEALDQAAQRGAARGRDDSAGTDGGAGGAGADGEDRGQSV